MHAGILLMFINQLQINTAERKGFVWTTGAGMHVNLDGAQLKGPSNSSSDLGPRRPRPLPLDCALVDPGQAVLQPRAREGADRLHVPVVVADAVQRQRSAHLLSQHRILEVLKECMGRYNISP